MQSLMPLSNLMFSKKERSLLITTTITPRHSPLLLMFTGVKEDDLLPTQNLMYTPEYILRLPKIQDQSRFENKRSISSTLQWDKK